MYMYSLSLHTLCLQSEDSDDRIHAEDRAAVKSGLVDLMLKSPPSVQKQLSAAIAVIGQEDFPAK